MSDKQTLAEAQAEARKAAGQRTFISGATSPFEAYNMGTADAYDMIASDEIVTPEMEALIEEADQPCFWKSNPVVSCGQVECSSCFARRITGENQ